MDTKVTNSFPALDTAFIAGRMSKDDYMDFSDALTRCRIAYEVDTRERSSWPSDYDDYDDDYQSDLFYPGNADRAFAERKLTAAQAACLRMLSRRYMSWEPARLLSPGLIGWNCPPFSLVNEIIPLLRMWGLE
jgi:hypothetical protein